MFKIIFEAKEPMNILISVIVLLIGIYSFIVPRQQKLKILLFSCICLNFATISSVSFGSASKIICVFFFISELRHFRAFISTLRSTPFVSLLLIMSGVVALQIITSPHLNNIITIVGFIVNELIAKYFVLTYIFSAYQESDDLQSFVNISFYSLLLLTAVGLYSILTYSDPLASITMSETGERFINHTSRRRVVSLFILPFDYGYACLMLLMFFIYAHQKEMLSSDKFITSIICAVFGIFFCGCRTVLVTSIIALSVFFYFRYSLMRFGWYIFAGVVLGVCAYSFSPAIQKTVDNTMSAFDPDAKMERGGSSTLKDRSLQYLTTYEYAKKRIWIGRGYRFFENDLGYNKNGDGLYSLKGKARFLLGLEGVLMRILLEQGLIGIAAYFIFYITLLRFSYRLRRFSMLDASAAMATLVAFICYGNMTGELGSAIITLFFTATYLKTAQEAKELASETEESEESEEVLDTRFQTQS